MNSRQTGLIAAPFTALNSDGSLNLAMIERQARALVENRVSGAFICGTTGEGLSLSTNERMQIAEQWMAVAPDALRVLVHVGHNSVEESRALAAHAGKINAHAFAMIAPTFFRAANIRQLVDFCSPVAAAAPSLPFYYYHMPAMTGADFPMFDFLKIAGPRIPNLAGIKFTHENLMDYHRCLNFEGGRFDILFGRDEILLSALALGAKSAVGSTYNFMAPIYHRISEAFNAGDLEAARTFQLQAVEIIALNFRCGGGAAVGKAMMKIAGLDCGPVRPPLQNLPPETVESLAREVKALGFPFSAHPTRRMAETALAVSACR